MTKKWDLAVRANYASAGSALRGQNFTVTTFEVGPKWNSQKPRRESYFAELLGGVVRPTSDIMANNAMAMSITAGVGMEYSLNERWSFRIIEVGVNLTTEKNGGDNLQENLRIQTGLKYRFNWRYR